MQIYPYLDPNPPAQHFAVVLNGKEEGVSVTRALAYFTTRDEAKAMAAEIPGAEVWRWQAE